MRKQEKTAIKTTNSVVFQGKTCDLIFMGPKSGESGVHGSNLQNAKENVHQY